MDKSTGSNSRRIKSVDQAFDILDLIEDMGSATLSDIADELDKPVSTVHIQLTTLVENGYLIKDDGNYRCSLKFLRKGGRMRDGMAIFQVAKPELDDLQQKTGEHTNLMVEEDGLVVQLYKSQGTETIDDDAPVGKHFHPHTTATGKAILAHQSDEKLEELLAEQDLPGLTDSTITDKEELYDDLQKIRQEGYSINREEHYPGVAAIGVVIESEGEDLLGAISISGPLGRMGEERIQDELVPALLTKKNIIELKLRQQS